MNGELVGEHTVDSESLAVGERGDRLSLLRVLDSDIGEKTPRGIFASVFDEKWLTGDQGLK